MIPLLLAAAIAGQPPIQFNPNDAAQTRVMHEQVDQAYICTRKAILLKLRQGERDRDVIASEVGSYCSQVFVRMNPERAPIIRGVWRDEAASLIDDVAENGE